MVTGIIGKKVGMTQVFTGEGNLVPVTVVQAGPCTVVQTKTEARDRYTAVQLGFAPQKESRVGKAMNGHVAKAGKGPFRVLREFRVAADSQLEVGQDVRVGDVFAAGDERKRRGPRRRQEAVEAKGYRTRARRQHSLAALAGWRYDLRPAPP